MLRLTTFVGGGRVRGATRAFRDGGENTAGVGTWQREAKRWVCGLGWGWRSIIFQDWEYWGKKLRIELGWGWQSIVGCAGKIPSRRGVLGRHGPHRVAGVHEQPLHGVRVGDWRVGQTWILFWGVKNVKQTAAWGWRFGKRKSFADRLHVIGLLYNSSRRN